MQLVVTRAMADHGAEVYARPVGSYWGHRLRPQTLIAKGSLAWTLTAALPPPPTMRMMRMVRPEMLSEQIATNSALTILTILTIASMTVLHLPAVPAVPPHAHHRPRTISSMMVLRLPAVPAVPPLAHHRPRTRHRHCVGCPMNVLCLHQIQLRPGLLGFPLRQPWEELALPLVLLQC